MENAEDLSQESAVSVGLIGWIQGHRMRVSHRYYVSTWSGRHDSKILGGYVGSVAIVLDFIQTLWIFDP